MRRLKVGVIGLGFMGELHARVQSQIPTFDLVAVADIDAARAREIAGRLGCEAHADYAQLLARPEIEAVTIVTPDRHHVAPAVAAAKAGKHILLEKPMAHDGAAAREIGAAVEAAGVRLMVGHVLHFDPRYAQIRDAAKRGDLGQVITARAKRNCPRGLPARVGKVTSILYYLGVHDIDMLQQTAGPIVRVDARRVQKLGLAEEDALYAVLEFRSGAIGLLDYNWSWPDGLPYGYLAQLEVIGTETAAFLDVRDQGLWFVGADGPKGADTHLWPEINGRIVGDLRDEVLHFAEAVITGRPFVQDWKDARDAIFVIDALFASLNEGGPVEVRR
ncbi:MAG: Gfo/Idh/MocA family oxidoreductase [Geminicoccaceae bacterium]